MVVTGTRSGLAAAEQALVEDVSAERIARWLEWFSANGLRLAGAPAEREAARYIAAELGAEGIACSLCEFDSFVSYGRDPARFGPATVTPLAAPDQPYAGKIYAFSGSTPPEGIEAELVFAGTGAPFEYAERGLDARGRLVLCELSFEAPHGEPARIAGEHGAIGVIVANWAGGDAGYVHTGTARGVWGNPTQDDVGKLPDVPMVAVSHAAGRDLRRRAEAGERVRLVAETSARWVRAVQPVAEIPGRSDELLLVYCHLDAFGAGMTDNATGVVGLMELARVLQRHRDRLGRTVRLAWWSSHEMPYNGSTWYLDTHWDELRDRCVAVLNADSWAIGDSLDQVLLWSFAELAGTLQAATEDVVGLPCPPTDFDAKEAEQTFWPLGVPSAMAFSQNDAYAGVSGMEYLGPWFHTEHDTIEHVGQAALAQLVRIYAVAAARLAAGGPLPLRYSAVGDRLHALLGELAANAPGELRLGELAATAAELATLARRVESAADGLPVDALNRALMRVGRIVNPVVYTVAGRYGQDPSSATYLRKRLPGLQRALDGLAALDGAGGELRPAFVTGALRERNRASDALSEACETLRDLLSGCSA